MNMHLEPYLPPDKAFASLFILSTGNIMPD